MAGDDADQRAGALSHVGFRDVYVAHYDALIRLAILITGSVSIAEDVVQDAYVALFQHWPDVVEPGAWLRRVVTNRSTSWLRRRLVARRHEQRRVPAAEQPPPAAEDTAVRNALLRLSHHRLADYPEVDEVAFSPGSTELAVQSVDPNDTLGIIPAPTPVPIIDLNGQRKRSLTLPAGYGLASSTAWSPDGRLLALDGRPTAADSIETLTFLDPSGAGRTVPAPVAVSGYYPSPVVWTGPDRLLVRATGKGSDSTNVVVELNLASDAMRQITWVDTGPTDNYELGDLQLATGLVTDMQLRPAGPPDRGPWPQWLRISFIVSTAVLVAVLALVIRVVRVRSRRRPGTPMDAPIRRDGPSAPPCSRPQGDHGKHPPERSLHRTGSHSDRAGQPRRKWPNGGGTRWRNSQS